MVFGLQDCSYCTSDLCPGFPGHGTKGAWSCVWCSSSEQHAHHMMPCYCQCVLGFNAISKGGDGKEAESFEQIPTCTKALKPRLPPAPCLCSKPLAADAGTALWRESAVPWWICPEVHTAGLSNPTWIFLLWGQFECSLWAWGVMNAT